MTLPSEEFEGSVSGKVPCALGLFLRSKTYVRNFKVCGTNVVFGRNIRIQGVSRIILGNNVIIDDNCAIEAKANTTITIGDGVYIGRHTRIECFAGSIFISNNTNISANCHISSSGRILIGRGAMIAGFVQISNSLMKAENDKDTTLHIGNNCWICSHASIRQSSFIGDNVTIGAGAVVQGIIDPNQTAVGNPARQISQTA